MQLMPIQVQIDPVMAQELKKLQPIYNLTKGQTTSIPVGIPLCKFGLGWDSRCDLDAGCIGLKGDGSHAFTCYFSNKDPIGGVVTSSGDNTTGKFWQQLAPSCKHHCSIINDQSSKTGQP